jgi:hypothetical protein
MKMKLFEPFRAKLTEKTTTNESIAVKRTWFSEGIMGEGCKLP